MVNNIFGDISLIIIVATVFAIIARKFRQPLIPAYMLAGIVLGPLLGIITNAEVIFTLSEIGIAFLLFIVGLEMDFKKIREVWKVAGIGGLAMNIFVYTFAFVVALFMGFFFMEAAYIGIIIAFSSTMVVVKLLSDKQEISSVHGRIVIGMLLLQDILAILALSVLQSIDQTNWGLIFFDIGKGVFFILLAWAGSKFFFPRMFADISKHQELLFLGSVSVCFLFSIIAHLIHYSIAIGSFLAGISLAGLPYHVAIIAKVKSLRDFFATIFFVSLGTGLTFSSFSGIVPLIVFVFLVVIFKPGVILFICSFFGYKRRIGFLSALSMAQISEFSLIIVAQGRLLGHIGQDIFNLAIYLALITIGLTSYFIKYENNIYYKFRDRFTFLDNFSKEEHLLEYVPEKEDYDIILIGHNRIGFSITKTVQKLRKKLLVVDFNPEVIKSLIHHHVSCIYGDIGDNEILDRLPFKNTEIVVSTISSKRINMNIVELAKRSNKKCVVYVTAEDVEGALALYDRGADYVVLPHFLGGDHISLMMEEYHDDVSNLVRKKLRHIGDLKKRRRMGHDHSPHDGHHQESINYK